MASKLAIALQKSAALDRLTAAMDHLVDSIGVDRPDIPSGGRDSDLLSAQQMEAIAAWAERIVEVVGQSSKAGDTPDFLAMTIAELRAYAAEREIDLGDARKKLDIVETIRGSDERVAA